MAAKQFSGNRLKYENSRMTPRPSRGDDAGAGGSNEKSKLDRLTAKRVN